YPGVALVDRIAVLVELQAAIEMRAGIDRPAPLVGDAAAVEQYAAAVVDRLELHPHVERVDRAGRKEMPDLARAHDDFHAHRLATLHRHRHAIERSEHLRGRTDRCRGRAELRRLLAHGERARDLTAFRLTDDVGSAFRLTDDVGFAFR